MSPLQEKRLLFALLKRLEKPSASATLAKWLRVVLWLVLVVAFMVLFQLAPHAGRSLLYVALGSAFLGIITTGVLVYLASIKQWSAIRKHLSIASIKERISELET